MFKLWQGSQGEPGFPGLQGADGLPGFKGHKVRHHKSLEDIIRAQSCCFVVKGVVCISCAISFSAQLFDVQPDLKYPLTRSLVTSHYNINSVSQGDMGEPGPKGVQVEPFWSLFHFCQPNLKLDDIYESSGYLSEIAQHTILKPKD